MSVAIRPLFSYGTLRAAEVQRALFGREVPGRAAALAGYRLLEDGGYYFAAPAAGKTVEGELLDLDERELQRTDAWEDVPRFYVRVAVTVIERDGGSRVAWMYTRVGATGAVVTAGA